MDKNNDEVIAIFMGWVIDNSFPDKNHVYRLGERIETKNTFKFSTSWDWLIPIVEKIESNPLNDVCIFKEATQIRVWDGGHESFLWKVLEPDGSSKIAHCYRAVVKYIEWYNLQPKQ
jgi:hypothetical protein